MTKKKPVVILVLVSIKNTHLGYNKDLLKNNGIQSLRNICASKAKGRNIHRPHSQLYLTRSEASVQL